MSHSLLCYIRSFYACQSLEGNTEILRVWSEPLLVLAHKSFSPPTAEVFSLMWNILFIHTAKTFRKFFLRASITRTRCVPILCSYLILSQENLESSTVLKQILLWFGYAEASRSGDSCHWKDNLFPGGQGVAWRAHWEVPGWVRRQREQGDRWARAFLMAEAG